MLMIFFAILFSAELLNTKKNVIRFHRLVFIFRTIIAGGFILSLILPFFGLYRYAMAGTALLTIAAIILSMAASVILTVKRVRNAYFYSAGLSALLIGGTLYIAKSFGILSTNPVTNWSLMVSTVLMVVLLSSAQADHVNIMRKINMELYRHLAVINKELQKAHNRLLEEMQIARKIQTVLLPENPYINGYEIAASMVPAHEVGGDYYDFLRIRDRDWILIGDVAGHGISPGLITMMVRTSVISALEGFEDITPSRLIEMVNNITYDSMNRIGGHLYMALTAIVSMGDGVFTLSGRHLDILIFRSENCMVERKEASGYWIGIHKSLTGYERDENLSLGIGDIMVLYSDGIIEAPLKNESGEATRKKERFGMARLQEIIRLNGKSPPEEIKDALFHELEAYDPHDDMTVIVIKRIG
jgi:serine phosphatase RsbU (regulator of sigma subunit)